MPISDKTRKILWARSGNRCSICRTELVLEKDQFNEHLNIGEECHIVSRQSNGPRHEKREGFDYDDSSNLLLLCRNHHKEIDDRVYDYPENRLHELKAEHEEWVSKNLKPIESTGEIVPDKGGWLSEIVSFVTSKHDIEMNVKSNRQMFHSEEGLQIAFNEAEAIKQQIYSIVESVVKSSPGYSIKLRDNKYKITDIIFKGYTLLAQFYQAYNNSASDSYLLFAVVKGLFDENGYCPPFQQCQVLEIVRLDFALDENGEFRWKNQAGNFEFYKSEDITGLWVNKFFKTVLNQ